MRRVLVAAAAILTITAARVDAVTVRDLVELSKAGLSDQVLVALIEVDRSIFTLDTATLKQLKDGGVTDAVIVAVIKSGRTQPAAAAAVADPVAPAADPDPQPVASREPQVIVIDHHDAQQTVAAPVAYPVAVPVYVPVPSRHAGLAVRGETLPEGYNGLGGRSVTAVVPTDQGLVKARVPVPANCTKAEPVYWGFGGKLRPGSWEPAPTVVCR